MSGTLSPGTRIPTYHVASSLSSATLFTKGYYHGLAEGGAVGIALGLLLGACLTALAWSHLGG